MITLKDCDIVICDYTFCGRPVVYYVVIGDKMISFSGDVNMGSSPRGYHTIESELPMECVRVYRPKHVTDTFNGNFGDERFYECIYARDNPNLVKSFSSTQMDASFNNTPYN